MRERDRGRGGKRSFFHSIWIYKYIFLINIKNKYLLIFIVAIYYK